jgi:predicted nucleotidyltransferase
MDVQLHLEDALGCRVDLATWTALRGRLRPGIEREAIPVT